LYQVGFHYTNVLNQYYEIYRTPYRLTVSFNYLIKLSEIPLYCNTHARLT